MRFTEFWAEVLSQNNALKWGLLSVSLISVTLTIGIVSLATKEPLLIERECHSQTLATTSAKQTDREIEQFVRFAVLKRFDSDASDSRVFLSGDEFATREKELEEFESKGMSQKAIVNGVVMKDGLAQVDADRIISFGKIRSALPLPLSLTIKTTDRSPANPYGLVLTDTKILSTEENNK